jgi:hypothetical protein
MKKKKVPATKNRQSGKSPRFGGWHLLLCLAAMLATAAADPAALFNEAVRLFFAAQPVESAKAFDQLVLARPGSEPELWQRGLALYYAGRFDDGRRQFELHRTVNPADVENVAWHFACVARDQGADAARQAIIPVGADARVPMREVLELFAGRAEPAAVLAAAEAGPEEARRNQRCFAHLYLGLYFEAIGDDDRARRHMLEAAGPFAMDHFMGRVAQLHCRLRGWSAKPPEGFTSLFNGTDLAGWRGRPHLDPRKEAEGNPEERSKRQQEWNADMASHWTVQEGVIVSDGHGVFLTTARDYGDIELLIEWMLPAPCADSGIYLRANPQVQIWDPDCERDFKHGNQKGSGGLWNSPADSPGKFPLVKADRPTGQWNATRIRMQGDRVTVVLNDQLVVDHQPLPNYFAKGEPLPARGPIQIQTHGAPMHVRNVFIRELPAAVK